MREPTTSFHTAPASFPELCLAAAAKLAWALERLRTWRVRIDPGSRLPEAVALLHEFGTTGRIAEPALGERVITALLTAYDFAEIAEFLPEERVAQLRKDLDIAVGGSLDQQEERRESYQFQSQLWFGTVLHRADLKVTAPKLPRGKRVPNPDFLVSNGATDYGLEVKRPVKPGALPARLARGMDQLRDYGVTGGVVVDLTDCLRGYPRKLLVAEVERLGDMLAAKIWDAGREMYQPGCGHVILLMVFARGAWAITETEAGSARLGVENVSYCMNFARYPDTVSDHHGQWLRGRIQRGLEQAGFMVALRHP